MKVGYRQNAAFVMNRKTQAAIRKFKDTGGAYRACRPARIPVVKHLDINRYYSRANERYDGLSPRDYLRGKNWDEQMSVGLDALRNEGVLK